VISSLFIMVVVVVAALPTHLFLASSALGGGTRGMLAWAGSAEGVAASLATVVVVGLLATFVPIVLGLRSFRRLEP
jgi:hypothetical protein